LRLHREGHAMFADHTILEQVELVGLEAAVRQGTTNGWIPVAMVRYLVPDAYRGLPPVM
jgi:hypothetical protein